MRRLVHEHLAAIENTLGVLNKVERYSIWRETELPKVLDNPMKELREKVADCAIRRFGVVSAAQ